MDVALHAAQSEKAESQITQFPPLPPHTSCGFKSWQVMNNHDYES